MHVYSVIVILAVLCAPVLLLNTVFKIEGNSVQLLSKEVTYTHLLSVNHQANGL